MPACAAVTAATTAAAVTAPAAMRDGAGRPCRRAERNGRSEHSTHHLQPHESLTSLCRRRLFVGSSLTAAPQIVIVAGMWRRIRYRSKFALRRDEDA
jgi:hypothetical protein